MLTSFYRDFYPKHIVGDWVIEKGQHQYSGMAMVVSESQPNWKLLARWMDHVLILANQQLKDKERCDLGDFCTDLPIVINVRRIITELSLSTEIAVLKELIYLRAGRSQCIWLTAIGS